MQLHFSFEAPGHLEIAVYSQWAQVITQVCQWYHRALQIKPPHVNMNVQRPESQRVGDKCRVTLIY